MMTSLRVLCPRCKSQQCHRTQIWGVNAGIRIKCRDCGLPKTMAKDEEPAAPVAAEPVVAAKPPAAPISQNLQQQELFA